MVDRVVCASQSLGSAVRPDPDPAVTFGGAGHSRQPIPPKAANRTRSLSTLTSKWGVGRHLAVLVIA